MKLEGDTVSRIRVISWKDVEVGKFQVGNSFPSSCFYCKIEKLESFLQLKTFQLLDLSNCPFQLLAYQYLLEIITITNECH